MTAPTEGDAVWLLIRLLEVDEADGDGFVVGVFRTREEAMSVVPGDWKTDPLFQQPDARLLRLGDAHWLVDAYEIGQVYGW